MLALLDDFLWVLRREGFAISIPEVVDVVRATCAVGLEDRGLVREAIACVVADSEAARTRFFSLFDAFFDAGMDAPPSSGSGDDPLDRLAERGWRPVEIEALRELWGDFADSTPLLTFRSVLGGGASLSRALAYSSLNEGSAEALDPLRLGFRVQRVLNETGLGEARSALELIAERLTEAFGPSRSAELVATLAGDLEELEQAIRRRLEERAAVARREGIPRDPRHTPFGELSLAEAEGVRLAVRTLAERLRGAARVRQRHLRRGRLDAPRTFRSMLQTGGVPFRPVWRDHRRERPKLALLCDVSDSVRPAAHFMLAFVLALAELFERTRSFVFVSEIAEVTSLFERQPAVAALAQAAGSAVNVRDDTSYGRALGAFEAHYMDAVDRRTTVVILGDARTNYRSVGEASLRRIHDRARQVLWLCTEPVAAWGLGDSAIRRIAPLVDKVLPAACAADLEVAARRLVLR